MNRALLYLALRIGNLWGEDHQIAPDISKITTAQDTFSHVGVTYVDGH